METLFIVAGCIAAYYVISRILIYGLLRLIIHILEADNFIKVSISDQIPKIATPILGEYIAVLTIIALFLLLLLGTKSLKE